MSIPLPPQNLRPPRALWIVAAALLLAVPPPARAGEQGQTDAQANAVAGRTLAAWTEGLKSSNRIVRLRAVKMLGTFGDDAIPMLTAALDPLGNVEVRYWASSALGDIGPAARGAEPALLRIIEHSFDDKLSAAYALCRIGNVEAGLPTLIEGLNNPEKAAACCAADFLARIGLPARGALPALRIAARHADSHVARAASEALRRIELAKGAG